ncbi:MAG: hypothetical protein WCY09_08920 [Candidatus Omnitrophota bacterium]|jgi:hypothetical protein
MEKTIVGGALAAVIGWIGLLQNKKVDRATCTATHQGVCEKLDLLLQRQKEHGDDVSYIRQRLDRHIDNSKSNLVM